MCKLLLSVVSGSDQSESLRLSELCVDIDNVSGFRIHASMPLVGEESGLPCARPRPKTPGQARAPPVHSTPEHQPSPAGRPRGVDNSLLRLLRSSRSTDGPSSGSMSARRYAANCSSASRVQAASTSRSASSSRLPNEASANNARSFAGNGIASCSIIA